MKHVLIVTILAAASLAAAQTTGAGASAKPAASGQSNSSQGAPAAPAAGTHAVPQPKTQEEFKAYQEVTGKSDPAEVEAAAREFAGKFPDSQLRVLLYRKAMYGYQNANNGEKTIDMAKQMLAIDPNSPEALVTFATITAQSTRETDLDRDERLNQALQAANKALQTVDSDLMVPPNAPPERVQAYKLSLRAMAYDAIGTVAMVKKDYSMAETNLRKSAETNSQPDPVTWLRLAVSLDQQKKYSQALDAANKAVQYSADSPQANNLAKMERDRLQKLTAASTPAPSASTPTPPASTPAAPGAPPNTPPNSMAPPKP